MPNSGMAIQLCLAELERRKVVLADGHRRTVPSVGPVEVRFANRRCFTGAMVRGDDVLLGAIPMEDMELVLRPQRLTVEVNPESPNIKMADQHSQPTHQFTKFLATQGVQFLLQPAPVQLARVAIAQSGALLSHPAGEIAVVEGVGHADKPIPF